MKSLIYNIFIKMYKKLLVIFKFMCLYEEVMYALVRQAFISQLGKPLRNKQNV